MVELNDNSLDRTLQALSDRTRRDILLRLGQKEQTVSELAEPYEISLAAVSKHLKVLEKAGLIDRHKEGRSYRFRMNTKPLIPVSELIKKYRAYWEQRMDELEHFVENQK